MDAIFFVKYRKMAPMHRGPARLKTWPKFKLCVKNSEKNDFHVFWCAEYEYDSFKYFRFILQGHIKVKVLKIARTRIRISFYGFFKPPSPNNIERNPSDHFFKVISRTSQGQGTKICESLNTNQFLLGFSTNKSK